MKFPQLRDVVHIIRAPYLFHSKPDGFLTAAIFTGSASTVHNSLNFGVIHAMIHAHQCCVFRFWNKVLFLMQ